MNPDEQAIRQLIARWHEATTAGDVDAVLPLMAEEVIFLSAGQPAMKGRNNFATALRSVLNTHRITSSYEVEEVLVSGNLAYSRCTLNVHISPKEGGKQITRSGNALSILRKTVDGSWQVIRDANLLAIVP